MRPAAAAALALSLFAVLSACAPFQRKADTPVATYLLDTGSTLSMTKEHGCHTLLINNVRSAPGYGTSRMVYVREPHRIEYFAFHRWADSPANMMHPVLVRAAERSGLFSAVIIPASPVHANLRLDMELVTLEQHMKEDASRIELVTRARLFGREEFLGSKLFEVKEEAQPNPGSGVSAANRALAMMTRDLLVWIAERIEKTQVACPSS